MPETTGEYQWPGRVQWNALHHRSEQNHSSLLIEAVSAAWVLGQMESAGNAAHVGL